MKSFFTSSNREFVLYHGDVREVLPALNGMQVTAIFADPPYFLSNGGFSVHAGKRVLVNKGEWDKSKGLAADTQFNCEWLKCCRDILAEDGTIWVCGTFHNIFMIASVLSELNFRILNSIVWQKTNPPPNLSCRMFTHSTEFVVWARKSKRIPHYYNYDLMHRLAGGRQMTDVWRLPSIGRWEKSCGKHPTQKPLALCVRAILASTHKGDLVLDPFAGSSTTGIAANLVGRRFVGVDLERPFLEISRMRFLELQRKRGEWGVKIPDLRAEGGAMM